jgi:hypothetical protein
MLTRVTCTICSAAAFMDVHVRVCKRPPRDVVFASFPLTNDKGKTRQRAKRSSGKRAL